MAPAEVVEDVDGEQHLATGQLSSLSHRLSDLTPSLANMDEQDNADEEQRLINEGMGALCVPLLPGLCDAAMLTLHPRLQNTKYGRRTAHFSTTCS